MTEKIKNAKILVVDDSPDARKTLGNIFTDAGFEVLYAPDAHPAIRKAQDNPDIDLITLDLDMNQMSGLEVLPLLFKINPDIPIIMITGPGGTREAVEAMKAGAYYYFNKDIEPTQLVAIASNAIREYQTRKHLNFLKNEKLKEYQIIGESNAITKVFNLIDKTAKSDKTVLITGESGTGKELVAHNIHFKSDRRDKPFKIVDTTATSASLFESELFGHVKGAFTDAKFDKKGKYEEADKGSIFLDEIGDLELNLQAKLLRVIETGQVPKIGSKSDIQVDVRHIVATKVDLPQAVNDGKFRDDLYYRMNVLNIELPPLRERREDIPILIDKFVESISIEQSKEPPDIEKDALAVLIQHDWPGNVRVLKQTIERLVIFDDDSVITARDINDILKNENKANRPIRTLQESVDDVMRTEIIKALSYTEGKKLDAAKLLDISPAQFYRYLSKFNLS